MFTAALFFSFAALAVIGITAWREFRTPASGIVMKAQGDGGSGGGDDGGWDFSNDDLPF